MMLQNVEQPGSGKVLRLTAGSKAMTDSAGIYLSYAKYVAYGMANSEEMIEDEIQGERTVCSVYLVSLA